LAEEARPGVLVTRPEPGAQETAARLDALGFRPVLAPALVLTPRPMAPVPRAQALLLASRAAARAAPLLDLPVLAVGAATAEAARARGFGHVTAADGDAAALAALAGACLTPAAGPLLLAVGQGYSHELARALRAQGFRVVRRIVYAAAPAPGLPRAAAAAIAAAETQHALFFSPRSAACSVELLGKAGLSERSRGMVAHAISPRVAAVLTALPWRAVRVASRPDQDHLLELLGTP
jgi:uroporphyrinogen-III synthase